MSILVADPEALLKEHAELGRRLLARGATGVRHRGVVLKSVLRVLRGVRGVLQSPTVSPEAAVRLTKDAIGVIVEMTEPHVASGSAPSTDDAATVPISPGPLVPIAAAIPPPTPGQHRGAGHYRGRHRASFVI